MSLFTLFIRPIDAGAEPTWEFPWPNDKSQSDPAYDISGYTYCGPSHDVEGPGAWNSPGEWDAKAIDFGLTDDLVSAAADGIVAKIRDAPFSTSGFGTYVILEHLGFFTMYAHLSDYPAWLDDGDRVRAGEVLATSGDTRCCGLHLHFQPGKGTKFTSVEAYKAEFMTGIEDATPDDYSGWNDFGNYGSCGLEDRSWYSAAPLSDVVIYDSGFTGGDATVHYANGAGDWRKNEQTSTDTCCYDVYPGFFGAPNNANRDEVSDLLFYYPGSRTYTRTEPGSSARALRA